MPHESDSGPWRVAEQTDDAGYVLLAHVDHDGATGHRLAVPVTLDDDGLGREVLAIYPCRVCGWARACRGGLECHS